MIRPKISRQKSEFQIKGESLKFQDKGSHTPVSIEFAALSNGPGGGSGAASRNVPMTIALMITDSNRQLYTNAHRKTRMGLDFGRHRQVVSSALCKRRDGKRKWTSKIIRTLHARARI
jgi:hypothetical protein